MRSGGDIIEVDSVLVMVINTELCLYQPVVEVGFGIKVVC